MPYGTFIAEDGYYIKPLPATSPPEVAPAPPPPPVDTSDVVSRYLNNVAAASPPPVVTPLPTPEYIASIDAQLAPTVAAANALMAGGGSDEMAAAAEAAGGTPEQVQAILDTDIPSLANVIVTSTDLTPVGTDIGIDPILIAQGYGHDDQDAYDLEGYFPDLGGRELQAVNTLNGKAFIDYVRAGCYKRDLDALAVMANAYSEGLGGGIGDNGTSYGPWQLHDGGALPRKYWNQGKNVARIQSWAWSSAGIDYALDAMATTSAKGKTGRDAVHALVYEFERPSDKPGQYLIRLRTYSQLASMGGGAWDWLAPYVKGPANVPATTPQAPPVKAQPIKLVGSWRDLIFTLRDDVPAAGVHMQNTAKRLRSAVT